MSEATPMSASLVGTASDATNPSASTTRELETRLGNVNSGDRAIPHITQIPAGQATRWPKLPVSVQEVILRVMMCQLNP